MSGEATANTLQTPGRSHNGYVPASRRFYLIVFLVIAVAFIIVCEYYGIRKGFYSEKKNCQDDRCDKKNAVASIQEEFETAKEMLPGLDDYETELNDLQFIVDFPKLIKAAHDASHVDFKKPLDNPEVQYWKKCVESNNYFTAVSDSYCLYLWLRILEHQKVERIDKILAVIPYEEEKKGNIIGEKPQQSGGMRLHLEGKVMAYWKPCNDYQNSKEAWVSEVISFMMDQLLGFYHTPPVIPRFLPAEDMLRWGYQAESAMSHYEVNAVEKVNSTLVHCPTKKRNGAEGALVGWVLFPVKLVVGPALMSPFLIRMEKMSDTELDLLIAERYNITQNSDPRDIQWAMENIAINMFCWIGGYTHKFDHNLFVYQSRDKFPKYGPFAYIDNDRNQWRISINSVKRCKYLEKICKFPRIIARRIYLLRPRVGNRITLGRIIFNATSLYRDTEENLFDPSQANTIDANVYYWYRVIKTCIETYGKENVLFDLPYVNATHTWRKFARN